MITSTIDLGQILIMGCFSIIGILLKNELSRISNKIEQHDKSIAANNIDLVRLTALLETITMGHRNPLARTRSNDYPLVREDTDR